MSIVPWSFSKMKAFEQCPKKFYHLKVAKDYTEPETSAMRYGTEFHLACEEYIRDGKPLPLRFEYAKAGLDALNRKEGEKLCEYEMGVTESLEPCDFKAPDVWFRGIVDLLILDRAKNLAWVIDYKTGKSARYADKDQLELMALATFAHFPEIKEVKAGLLFVVPKKLIKAKYRVEDKSSLWDKWKASFDNICVAFESDTFNPKPSGLCKRHCIITECVHNGGNR